MTSDLLSIDPPAIEPGGIAPDAAPPVHESAEPSFARPAPIPTDFDWWEDDSVIIQEQLRVAVYRNKANAVVIRQEARSWDDDDMFICLASPLELRTLIAALQRELKG